MSTETHPQPTAPAARQRTSPAPTTQPDNPPIQRADGTCRPLDQNLVDRLVQNFEESYRRNPDYHKMMAEQWDEFGDILPL